MKTFLRVLLFCIAASCAPAQTPAPQLAPLAAKYKADIAVLESQRVAAHAQAQIPYTTALAAAEKAATAAGNVAAVAAITAEREAIGSGLMPPGFPDGLPKELHPARKAYLDACTRDRAVVAQRRQAIDADYLRALTKLEPLAARNPELAQQIAAEKQSLLASAVPGGPAPTGATVGTSGGSGKSAVINGTFELADGEGHPSGWTTSESFKVARDGSKSILRATAKAIGRAEISQDIAVPAKAKTVTVHYKVRGKPETSDQKVNQWGARIYVAYIGANDQRNGIYTIFDAVRESAWKTMSKTGKIPAGTKAIGIYIAMVAVTGTFDFSDVVVEFH